MNTSKRLTLTIITIIFILFTINITELQYNFNFNKNTQYLRHSINKYLDLFQKEILQENIENNILFFDYLM